MAQPRIAVVGGGIAGTLCSLVLRNRGASPVIIDSGKNGVGGRLRGGSPGDAGVQFLRAADPRLAPVMMMLEREKLVAKWTGRFGMLGSVGGGFLPSEVVGKSSIFPGEQNDGDAAITRSNASDGGDFCGFVTNNRVPTYVGIPCMSELCPNICHMAGIDVVEDSRVLSAETAAGGGWRLVTEGDGNHSDDEVYDALVLSTHDPSLASSTVRSIAAKEAEAADEKKGADKVSISSRLFKLADALQAVRDFGRMPVYTFSAIYPEGFSDNISFDAASVHGSPVVQYLARDASKPGRQSSEAKGDLWTAVSTSQFAGDMLLTCTPGLLEPNDKAGALLAEDISRLLAPSFGGDASLVPKPLGQSIKLWRAGFNSSSLDLLEDSVALAPWRLAIGGEYISNLSTHATPFEAAALSGLEAGERVSTFFQA